MDQPEPGAGGSRWERLNDHFQRALALPAAEREPWLDSACADDPALRSEIAELLASDADVRHYPTAAVSGFEGALGRATTGEGLRGRTPERIGRYRVLRVIGEGGMGIVYEAEEDEPPRKVALKVIRRDVLSAEAARRFELEARVLARLDHPGIARVHAVGTGAADGEPPWIAMELVHGRSLFEHAAERGLDARERVHLVAQVADAVAHAHSRGVIHRDVKPSNVLVDETGRPRVLDFGVARLVGPDGGLSTVHTGFGRIVGTIAYMSPEQASGDPDAADERSDIYALGVVAFELLAGRTPHDLGRLPLPLALERLMRDDPPTLGTVRADLRGDLSVVIAKATAREPGRRYAGAATFAEDLRRFLRFEPVSARPPTAGYYAKKFLRRHRALVIGTLIAFLALATSLVLALRAKSEEVVERRRADGLAASSRRAAYRAELAGAAASWRAGDPQAARLRLEQVPEALRAWEWRHLAAELGRRRRPLVPTPAGARTAVLVPGTDRWLTLEADGALTQRDPDGNALARLADRAGGVVVGAGALLVDAGAGFRVLPADGGAEHGVVTAGTLARDPRAPTPLALSADGRLAVFGSPLPVTGHAIPAWLVDLETGTMSPLGDPNRAVFCAVFSPRGDRAALGESEGTVRVVDLGTHDEIAARRLHGNAVHTVAFDPAGRRVASGSDDRTLCVWAPASADAARCVRGFRDGLRACAWSADGNRLVAGDAAGCVLVTELAGDRPPLVLDAEELGGVAAVGFSADGRAVTAVGPRGRLELDAARAEELGVLRGHLGIEEGNPFPYVYAVSVSPQGDRVASGGWDGRVCVHDVRTGARVLSCDCGRPVYSVAYAPRGDRIAAGCVGGYLHVFDAASGALVFARDDLRKHQAQALAWSPDGERIAVAREDGRLVERSSTTLEVVATPPVTLEAAAAAYSPDGARIALIGGQGEVEVLWRDGRTAPLRRTLHAGFGVSVAWSHDGKRLVTTGEDGNVVVSDAETLRPLSTFRGHRHRSYSAVFFPDGTRVASGGNDGVVRISDPVHGEELVSLEGHQAYVYGVAVSSDGETVASASGDNTVRVWSTVPFAERVRRAAAPSAAGR